MFQFLNFRQEPVAAGEVDRPEQVPASESAPAGDRYGDVALGVESAWPTGVVAR
jgi:hypothetical protein